MYSSTRTVYLHYRLFDRATDSITKPGSPSPQGGVTVCFIPNQNDPTTGTIGLALCSLQDNYCKPTGRRLATFRASAPEQNQFSHQVKGINTFEVLQTVARVLAANLFVANLSRRLARHLKPVRGLPAIEFQVPWTLRINSNDPSHRGNNLALYSRPECTAHPI